MHFEMQMTEIYLGSFTPLLVDDTMKLILSHLSYKELVSLRCVSTSWLDCHKYTAEHWFEAQMKRYDGDGTVDKPQNKTFFIKNFAKGAKLTDYPNLDERLANHVDIYDEKTPYSLKHILDADKTFLQDIQYSDASLAGFLHFYYLETGNLRGVDRIRSLVYVPYSDTPLLLKRASELNNRRMFIYCLKSFLEYDNEQGPILIYWPKNMEYERKVIEKYFDCHWYSDNPVDCTLGPGNYVVSREHNSYIKDQIEDDEYITVDGAEYIVCEYALKKIDILLGPPYTQTFTYYNH